MFDLVQANARVPENARPLLLAVAARLREDPGFVGKLKDFLADDAAGNTWADRLAAIEARLEALEARRSSLTQKGGRAVAEAQVAISPHPRRDDADDWAARVASLAPISTRTGRTRRLAPQAGALFDEAARAGVKPCELARLFGLVPQSAAIRAKKVMSQI